jgi:hypothetical protein
MRINFLFMLYFLTIGYTSAALLETQLTNLADTLKNLQHSLQQGGLQQHIPPPHTSTQKKPSVIETTIWDSVKPLYIELLAIKINTIQNEELRKYLQDIFNEWYASFSNLAHFQQALQNFIAFAESKAADGPIQEPEAFRTLVKEYNKFFGPDVIDALKASLYKLEYNTKFNKPPMSRGDIDTAADFLKKLSEILNTIAEKVKQVRKKKIIPADRMNNTIWEPRRYPWPQPAKEPEGPRSLTDWFTEYISRPLATDGYAHNQHPTRQNDPEGLNMGYIDRAISALKATASRPSGQQQSKQYENAFSAIFEKYSQTLSKRPKISDQTLDVTMGDLSWEVAKILENLIRFGISLDKFAEYIQSESGTIQEPDLFVELVNGFDSFFGPEKIREMKKIINALVEYKSNTPVSPDDKEIVRIYLKNFSDLLNQIYLEVNQFAVNNIDTLQNIMWLSQFPTVMGDLAGERSAIDWFADNILYPLRDHARLVERYIGGELNSHYVAQAIKAFK